MADSVIDVHILSVENHLKVQRSEVKCSWVKFKWEEVKCREE